MRTTCYYVQISVNGGLPQNIYYSKNGYKFMDKGGARLLLDKEKASDPKQKYRIVKIVETITVSDWE